MSKDHNAKLAAVEASIVRWQSRLARASNALQKALKQRRRLLATKPAVPRVVEHHETTTPAVETGHTANLDLPQFLDRRNPDGIRKAAAKMQAKADAQLVDALKAKRADQVEADKKKMPLTGRAALDYVRQKPKKSRRSA